MDTISIYDVLRMLVGEVAEVDFQMKKKLKLTWSQTRTVLINIDSDGPTAVSLAIGDAIERSGITSCVPGIIPESIVFEVVE